MSVSIDYLSGTPTYSGNGQKLHATVKGVIDWSDIDALYLELFPSAVGDKPSLPALLSGSSTLFASNVTFEPWLGEDDITTCSGGLPSYSKAVVTMEFDTIPYTQGSGSSDQIITRRNTISGDAMILPSAGCKWAADGAAVLDPDVRAAKIVPMRDIIVTLHRVTPAYFATLNANVSAQVGTVNSATFEGHAAESLLLLGMDSTENVTADGTTTRQCEVKFQKRVVFDAAGNPQGWNYFYRPNVGQWQRLQQKDGSPIYKLTAFANLYS